MTNNDLVGTSADRGVHQAGALSTYSTTERDQLRALGGLDEASDGDLDMLATVAQRTGLDPFLKHIYLVGRKTKVGGYRGEPERWETKWTVQAGIDGFRNVLFRYAQSLGVSHSIGEPTFFDRDGNERRIWLKEWGYPAAARVEVRVGDNVGVGLATWDEFVQTKKDGKPNSMWEKLGPTMLVKCAEAQGHRRVCSLTAGIYVDEEMMQADTPVRATATRADRTPGGRGRAGLQNALAPAPAGDVIDDPFSAALTEITSTTDRGLLEGLVEKWAGLVTTDEEVTAVAEAGRQRWTELAAEQMDNEHE